MSKKLFLILSLIVTTGCNFFEDHDGWKKLGSTANYKYYIKTSTINKKENESSGLVEFVYNSLQDFSKADIKRNKKLKDIKGYKSVINLIEADCSKYNLYFKEERLFNEEGEEVFAKNLSERTNVKPGSAGENIYDTLCQ